jgi:protein tyrosine phosphatase
MMCRLVWEQNVHVIVMLTREIEGSMVKCGNYWADGQYGRLRLRLVSTTGPPTSDDVVKPDATPSPFFASAPVQSPDGPPTIIRTFELTHTSFPYVKARTITHFQYTEWPDMNVPESPTGLLDLIRSVGTATAQTEENINIEVVRSRSSSNWTGSADAQACKISGIAKHALGHRPLLLHCSAGVGRTGGFITVDAVLDGIRRELSDTHLTVSPQFGDMVVDSSESTDDNTPGRSMVDASVSMDVDAPSSTSQHTPSRSLAGPSSSRDNLKASRTSPKMSAYRKGRGAGVNAWGKNDPRRMPLRKWLVSTTDAAAREAQLASPAPHTLTASDAPLVASPLPAQGKILSPPLTASPLPTPSTRMDDPMSDDQPTKTARATFPLMSAPRLLAPDAPRTRAFSTPTSTEGVGARRLALGNVTSSMLAGSPVASMSSTNLPSVLSSAVVPSVFSSDAAESSMTSDASPPPSTAPPKTLLGASAPTPTQALTPPSTTAAFDYTAPRMLHTSTAPLTLSSFSEPIRAVIEDAREQRMSLCQSLRQYVFVHQAIVEGALAIVDELRAAEAGSESAQADVSMSTLQAPPSMRPNKAKRRRSTMDADVIREDSKGAVSLSKRPSIKRVTDGSRA